MKELRLEATNLVTEKEETEGTNSGGPSKGQLTQVIDPM